MSLESITNYFPSPQQISSYATRETFRLGVCTVGSFFGSKLAGNACLLNVPSLLNQFGYQIGSSSAVTNFVPSWFQNTAPTATISWVTGQATLSISYPFVEAALTALGGVVGTLIAYRLVDGALFAFDLALMDLGFSEIENEAPASAENEVSQAASRRSNTNYFPSPQQISSYATRETFRLGVCTVGSFFGSKLAGNACLLNVPSLLNQFGYQIGSSSVVTNFVPSWFQNTAPTGTISWVTGQATLSISYPFVEAALTALGGVVGTLIAYRLVDGALFAFDLALMDLGFSEIENEAPASAETEVSQAASRRSNVAFHIVNGRLIKKSS